MLSIFNDRWFYLIILSCFLELGWKTGSWFRFFRDVELFLEYPTLDGLLNDVGPLEEWDYCARNLFYFFYLVVLEEWDYFYVHADFSFFKFVHYFWSYTS